ncbi:MAG TPA: ATP-binding cassette domain-containing protein [Polyangiaceae bacterium]
MSCAARLASLRDWTRSTRRALNVSRSLELPVPALPAQLDPDLLALRGVSAQTGARCLFESIDLPLGRERVAVVGPNGAGKTSLLEIMLGQRTPDAGSAARQLSKIGSIEQGGANWQLLILDEPTFSLDLLGQRALTQALRAWPGGLVVASHDREFLAEIGIDRTIRLGA